MSGRVLKSSLMKLTNDDWVVFKTRRFFSPLMITGFESELSEKLVFFTNKNKMDGFTSLYLDSSPPGGRRLKPESVVMLAAIMGSVYSLPGIFVNLNGSRLNVGILADKVPNDHQPELLNRSHAVLLCQNVNRVLLRVCGHDLGVIA